jgi:cyclohexanone monooxygenase
MGLTQTGLAPNFTYMLNGQASHIAYIVTQVQAHGAKGAEPTPEVEDAWVKLVTGPTFMSAYQDVCTPGYYNAEGKNDSTGFLQQYPDGAVTFYNMLAKWRDEGKMEGLIVK